MKSLAGIFFTAVNLLYATVFGGPIDGTAWDVKVKEEGFFHWGSTRDTLVFHDGKAVIAGEVAKGYSPALYDAKDESGGTAFAVTMQEPGRERVEWTGRVDGERITGAIVVRAQDGKIQRYVFTGERKSG
jgi:hypothetical protein